MTYFFTYALKNKCFFNISVLFCLIFLALHKIVHHNEHFAYICIQNY